MTERELVLETPTGVLHGTLAFSGTVPSATTALLLAGSGPTDRDGNSAIAGIRPATLKLLAADLAASGITTLRVDKRGIAASAAAGPREEDVRFSTFATDAKAWVERLRAEVGAPCVWLIGHSEGALVAEVAASGNPVICGLVLIAAPGRRAGDVLREQLEPLLPPALKEEAFGILVELEAGRPVDAIRPELLNLFRPSVQPYMISWLALDPAAILAGLPLPTLILQGETDIQVGVRDAQALLAARPDARLVLLPGVNHVLKEAPADRAANAATYADPDLPLTPAVSAAVADFILANTRA